jgi:hypothetical protein
MFIAKRLAEVKKKEWKMVEHNQYQDHQPADSQPFLS